MAWLHFSRTVTNLALSAALTWYLGVGAGFILSLWLWLWACGCGFQVVSWYEGGCGVSLTLSLKLWLWACGCGFHVARFVGGGRGRSGQSCCEWLQNLSEGSQVLTWSPSSHSPSTAAIFLWYRNYQSLKITMIQMRSLLTVTSASIQKKTKEGIVATQTNPFQKWKFSYT